MKCEKNERKEMGKNYEKDKRKMVACAMFSIWNDGLNQTIIAFFTHTNK